MTIMKNIKQSESWKKPLLRWSLEMPEMSGKCKSNPTKTYNLIYILKITQKKRKQTLKKRKLIYKLRIWNFFWKLETDPKKEEMDPKKRKRTQKGGNRSKTEILKLFFKTGNGPKKMRKRTQKKEETDQQTEN